MISVTKLDHLSAAIPKWEPQFELMQKLFGLKFLHEFSSSPGFPFGGCVAQVHGTNMEWELLTPNTPDSFVQKFLDDRGPGLHHITLEVEDIDEAAAEMERLGMKPFGGITEDSQWRMTYIHPKDSNGILWQLFSMLPGSGGDEDRTATPGELGAVRFDHVSMAVDDLDKQIEWQTRVLGMEALRRWQDDELGYKAAIMSIPGSDLEFEIMAPIREDSFVRKFIDERGKGMHHVCVEVESTEAAAAALERQGITPFRGIIDNGWKKHTFIHPKDSGGVLFQLFEERDD